MAMQVKDVREWLGHLSDDELIAIDPGGLTIVAQLEDGTWEAAGNGCAYLDVGGVPDEEEEGQPSGDGPPYDAATATGMYDRD